MLMKCLFGLILVLATSVVIRADPIPDGFDKNITAFVFLVGTNGQPTTPNGTCFFVGVDTPRGSFVYLVTAKHVLQESNGAFVPQICVRMMNTNDEAGFAYFPLNDTNGINRVFTHPEKGVDLAVVPVVPNIGRNFHVGVLPADLIATKERMKKFKVREGDEMFFMGLFTPFYGSKANFPIVRFGRLSMLTDERIPADKDGPQEYYLMETQVFGGNSGSAALFYFDERRNPMDTKILLAGVIKGYFVNYAPIKFIDTRATPFATENNGIALVTPGFKLNELLYSDELKRLRGE